MGIKIDEQTQILYEDHVVDAKAIAEDYDKWEGARKISADGMMSTGPEDQLVLRDIFDSPIDIVRAAEYGDLVLQASIIRLEGDKKRKWDRPYTAIALTPTEGQVASVKYLQNGGSGISFSLKEATPTHIAFDGIKNRDLEMRVDFQSE